MCRQGAWQPNVLIPCHPTAQACSRAGTPAADLAKGGGIFCRLDATCLFLCLLLLVQVASAAGARAQRSLSARVHASSTSTTVEQKPAAPAAAPNGGGGGGTRVMIIGACVSGGESDRVCQCESVREYVFRRH